MSLPVYPGDQVRIGQVVARLDTSEVSAKAAQADSEARQSQIGACIAEINHHLYHQAALDQTTAQDVVADAQAGVQSA